MTKHWDVNKCSQKEKCKMPKSGKLTSRYKRANKPKIKKNKKHGEREEGEEKKTF